MKQYQAILLALFCAALAPVGKTVFRLGAAQVPPEYTDWVLNGRGIVGLGTYGLSALIVAPKFGELSILSPLIATG